MKNEHTTLLVIGGGPGGYVAAIRAGQLGIPTVLVERDRLGGTCLNIGCIPSKALIHVADAFEQARGHAGEGALGIRVRTPEIDIAKSVAWKDGIVDRLTRGVGALLKKNGVRVLHGDAQVVDGKTVDVVVGGHTTRISCEHLLLATGSEPVALPSMPFGGHVVSSTEALSPETLPKRLVVVGAGYIGLELGIVYRKLGVDVSVVEAAERVLPAYDAELARPVADSLARLGVRLLLGHKVLGLAEHGAVRVQAADGAEQTLQADRVLVAVGRRPRVDGFGLESLPLDRNGRALWIDDECRTSMRNVWAIGDVAGEPMLAHRAMAQGEMVAELIAGKRRKFVPASIPAVCFTDPEIVTAGWSPDDARAADVDCVSASFPFAANGRAMTLQATDGFVRVVARRDTHLIVGWQAVGRGVSELAAAFSQSLEMGARLEDIGGTIHAHPTLGEALQEAALRALGHAVHV
ncbi:dihydrolipoyl dehydrogenase [Burkholderia contaminans]|uniref:Dihydrolipoyl dehydrogenase n=1 Tax=Burkholderia contaminans TaxID=488447 RepID=A0A6P3B703_9BURK|nr:dihydrolipoyl dehydrogenase [Burkholderia contaminans]VWD55611.1 dihydrolipoamide dehydrogenase [Burkholderia contaminans]